MEWPEPALAFPGRHGAAQRIGLAGREVGGDHRDLHHLLLEDRHAFRALQRRAQRLRVVDLVVLEQTVLQVGMHHAALDGPGPHDRHLDHQVVVPARPQPRQHAHLRAALDLEYADGVGGADHVVGGFVALRDLLRIEAAPALARQQLVGAPQRAEHAQREDVDLDEAERVEVVLVPLHDAAVLHAGVLHRHQLLDLVARDDEAAGVLREVARKADQLVRQRHPLAHHRRLGVEAVLAQALGADAAAVEPLLALGHRGDALLVDAQRAADVAQRAARPVADHHRRQRGAVAAVFAVDVLDDLLAALVLEVDVDVGRLAALDADEALEQQRGLARIHLGDAQAEAHHRVGRAAAALAQDALLARPAHDVGDGEEVGLVVELADQRELVLDALRRIGARAGHVLIVLALGEREAPLEAGERERAQVAGRRLPSRHQLLRVFVLQLGEREAARPRHHQRVLQPLGLVQARQARARAQVLLGVGRERGAAFAHRALQARGGERVLQGLARAQVHQHVAGGDDAQAAQLRDALDHRTQRVVARAQQQLERDRGARAVVEPGLEPHRLVEQRLEALRGIGQQQREAARQAGEEGCVGHVTFDIAGMREVLPLGRAAPRHGDPVRQVAVAATRLREHHEARAGRQAHLRADDQARQRMRRRGGLAARAQARALAFDLEVRAHHAGERALVGEGQRRVAELPGALHQLAGVRRPAQEAEVAAAVQLGVARQAGPAAGRRCGGYGAIGVGR